MIKPRTRLSPSARVLLLSDLHLGDGSTGDLFGHKDALLAETLAREARRADVIVLDGDVFDHMRVGRRSRQRMERAHAQAFAALRALPERCPVYYVAGNHEDLAATREAFADFRFVDALAVGDEICVTHGHRFDLHWNGARQSHFAASFHGLLETALRRTIRQPFRDHVNGANRVVHRLFFRWTQLLRLYGAAWRLLGRDEPYERWQGIDNFWARGQWGDIGGIFEAAVRYHETGTPWRVLVLGHSHCPGVVPVDERFTYVNLGSWCLDQATYAWIEDGRARVFDALTDREIGDEGYRMLGLGLELPDMAAWFRRYYLGWFRYDLEAIHRDFPLPAEQRERRPQLTRLIQHRRRVVP